METNSPEATLKFVRLWIWHRFQTPVIKDIEYVTEYSDYETYCIEFKVNDQYFLCASNAINGYSKHWDKDHIEVDDLLTESDYDGPNREKYQKIRQVKPAFQTDSKYILSFLPREQAQIDYMYSKGKMDAWDPNFDGLDETISPMYDQIILLSE